MTLEREILAQIVEIASERYVVLVEFSCGNKRSNLILKIIRLRRLEMLWEVSQRSSKSPEVWTDVVKNEPRSFFLSLPVGEEWKSFWKELKKDQSQNAWFCASAFNERQTHVVLLEILQHISPRSFVPSVRESRSFNLAISYIDTIHRSTTNRQLSFSSNLWQVLKKLSSCTNTGI